jgi:molybdopterin-binding protein
MKTSARNHFAGEVSEIKSGAVNDEITLKVGDATLGNTLPRASELS